MCFIASYAWEASVYLLNVTPFSLEKSNPLIKQYPSKMPLGFTTLVLLPVFPSLLLAAIHFVHPAKPS